MTRGRDLARSARSDGPMGDAREFFNEQKGSARGAELGAPMSM